MYPDRTLEHALTEAGIPWLCAWEMRSPKNSGFAWLHAILVGPTVMIVQTYRGGGWQVYLPVDDTSISGTVSEVIARVSKTRKKES